MRLLAHDLNADEHYRIMSGTVVPRPIAWVTTLSENGKVNAAPFSAFTMVSTEPPMLGISITRREGRVKDTENNIRFRKEFVINIADRALTDAMHHSSFPAATDISEVEALGLELEPSGSIETPALKATPVSFECVLHHVQPFGRWHHFIAGEIVAYQIRDDLLINGKVDTLSLDPICRIGGPNYATLGTIIAAPRATLRLESTD